MAHRRLQPANIPSPKNTVKNPGNRKNTELKSDQPTELILFSEKRCKHPEHWVLLILIGFLLGSIGCFQLSLSFPAPSAQLQQLFGQAPPLLMLNCALGVYLISELLLTLGRSKEVATAFYAVKQILFLFMFYGFYWACGFLAENFSLICLCGSGLILGEYLRLWHLAPKATSAPSRS